MKIDFIEINLLAPTSHTYDVDIPEQDCPRIRTSVLR